MLIALVGVDLDRYDRIRGEQLSSQPEPSVVMPINEAPVLLFALMLRSAMLEIDGASFTDVTVMLTVAGALSRVPSEAL